MLTDTYHGLTPVQHSVLKVKTLLDAVKQEKALEMAFSMIVKLCVIFAKVCLKLYHVAMGFSRKFVPRDSTEISAITAAGQQTGANQYQTRAVNEISRNFANFRRRDCLRKIALNVDSENRINTGLMFQKCFITVQFLNSAQSRA